jgi:hypothetical protein
MKKYKLADGVKAQALAVHVQEQRPGLSYAVSVRKDVLLRPGEVVETEYDLSAWVKAGLVVEAYDPAAQFKAALPVAEPAPAAAPAAKVEEPEPEAEAVGEGEGEATAEGSSASDAAPLAKAAARAARRRG